MAIPTRQGVVGFFMSDPQLNSESEGRPRMFAWVGLEDPTPNQDGTYPPPTRTQLVMFNTSATRAAETFRNGDNFVATGRADISEYHGQQHERFIASSIGPDNNLATIHLQRGRTEQHTRDAAAPEHAAEVDPAAAALARLPRAGSPISRGAADDPRSHPPAAPPLCALFCAAPGRNHAHDHTDTR